MILYERVAHEIDVEEAARRGDHDAVDEEGGGRALADPSAKTPQRHGHRRSGGEKSPADGISRADLPARVDEHLVDGKEELPRIEPDDAAGDHCLSEEA